MTYVWLAVFAVGAALTIFALLRTYRSLRLQGSASAETAESVSMVARPDSELQTAKERIVRWEPGLESPWWFDAGGPFQPIARRPRKWPYVVAIVVLAAGVLGLGAGYAYSTYAAGQWRTTADNTSQDLASMTAERDHLAKKNTSLSSQLGDTRSKLNDTTSQLNDANARIRSLANEKAQLGDNRAFLAELVIDSQNVSTEMSTCIDDLQRLQAYLVDFASYDQASLIAVVRSVNVQCNTARADSDALTRKIQGQ